MHQIINNLLMARWQLFPMQKGFWMNTSCMPNPFPRCFYKGDQRTFVSELYTLFFLLCVPSSWGCESATQISVGQRPSNSVWDTFLLHFISVYITTIKEDLRLRGNSVVQIMAVQGEVAVEGYAVAVGHVLITINLFFTHLTLKGW